MRNDAVNHGLLQFWQASDGIGRAVALLLLAMSVAAWVLILWKGWQLRRAAADIERAVPAFWAAASLDDGRARLGAMDREKVLLPLLDAALALPGAGTLEGAEGAKSAFHSHDQCGPVVAGWVAEQCACMIEAIGVHVLADIAATQRAADRAADAVFAHL